MKKHPMRRICQILNQREPAIVVAGQRPKDSLALEIEKKGRAFGTASGSESVSPMLISDCKKLAAARCAD
ncbi:MAG: hypothetical protein JSS81_26290 [Acidobacteria bacterium]|nr:hypothetical protein [Acidobacteriota bacterium]